MVMLSLFSFVRAAVLATVIHVCGTLAVPSGWDSLDNQARDILARATPAAPHFVVYGDKYTSGTTGPPAVSSIKVGAYREHLYCSDVNVSRISGIQCLVRHTC